MFIINRGRNEACALNRKSFSELSFSERDHLQEWIDKNPIILGEPLLIIQKEFDGFSDTWERLDLLALDENGQLVIIENKLDDSGKDVVWQALKYVSYCATLSKSEILKIYQKYLDRYHVGSDAVQNLIEFFNCSDYEEISINTREQDQRIILVAANFRKEVTSTVLWLQDHGLNIKCVRVTPYQMDESIFLDTEQILPPPNTGEYQISLSNKKMEENTNKSQMSERRKLRKEFWAYALPILAERTGLYQNISFSNKENNWIAGNSGIAGIGFNSVILLDGARAELYIGRPIRQENKDIFNELLAKKDEYNQSFGTELEWAVLDDKIASRISVSLFGMDLKNRKNWDAIVSFLSVNIAGLLRVFKMPLQKVVERVL